MEEKRFPAKEVKRFQNRVCSFALLFGSSVSFFSLILGMPSVAKGFLLGTCFSVINFILMCLFLPFSWGKESRKAGAFSLGSLFIRYAVLSIPIIVAIKDRSFNIAATVAGIFSVQMVLFGYYVILKPLLLGE